MKSFLRTILFLGFIFTPFIALAVPDIPHQFYGTVNFSNGPAPDGLIVEARTSIGTVVGVSTTRNGKYGYSPNLFFVTDDNDGTPKDMLPGQEIKFFVNGIDTGTTTFFSNGGYSEKNLVIGGAIGIISKLETEVISNQTIAVSPQSATTIKMGDSLNITVSSIANTNAVIEKIEKLSSGNVAIFSGKNLLNAFDIKITGESLNISVTMKYSDAGIDEDTIIPYWFNTTSNSWVAITPFTVDKTANTITFTIFSGQTTYAVFGQVPTPSGGGPTPTPTTPTPTPTPLSAQAQKVDANKDNKIDILDFNSLMVSWGSIIAGTIADFNGDNKVDIFDFNLLMIYWTG